MSDFDEAARLARANRPSYRNTRIKVTGFLDTTTGVVGNDPTENAQPGYLWVHGYPRGANVQVIAGTAINPYLPNARVYVGENEANQAVAYAPVIDRGALEQFGAVLAALMQPSGADELLARSIAGRGFVPGRLEPSQLGGLYAHIRSFWYEGGYYDGDAIDEVTGKSTLLDFDLEPYLTVSAADTSQWVAVYFDPADAEPHVVVSTPVFGEPSTLPFADLLALPIPYGVYPLGAFGVAFGQTTLTGASTNADLRQHLDSRGGTVIDFNRIVVDADGAVVTDSDGFVVVDFGD